MKSLLKKIKRGVENLLVKPQAIIKRALNIKTSAVDFPIPWITSDATKWMERYLSKEMVVFEYGSGGSTLYIAPRVKKIISLEYDVSWYKKIRFYIRFNNINNCQLELIKPELEANKKHYSSKSFDYKSSNGYYSDFSFEKYCKYINTFPDKYFDLIIVDGRSRNSCVLESMKKIKDGGYILLDDSQRDEYNLGINYLSNLRRIDFPGFDPFKKSFLKTTTIFQSINN